MRVNKKHGEMGEDLALLHLETKGYQLVMRHYRYKRAEIDLIVSRDQLLVFVEVKARKNADFGFPESFVSDAQKERILMAAENYLLESPWAGPIRFDIVSILLGKEKDILHIEDAFY